ncbi:ribonuclease H-like protein [Hypoxylon sp. EC38]|nr:ribonuclease H-like protein [Hypoxylon sp. EC38]
MRLLLSRWSPGAPGAPGAPRAPGPPALKEIIRRFDPLCSTLHGRVPEGELVVYNPLKKISQLQLKNPRTGEIELDKLTVVVSIDGACRGNGTPSARAAWGVYFGPYNASGVLESTLPQTSTRAEIEALSQALHIIRRDLAEDLTMQQFRIRTDSDFLVKAVSEWIEGWIARERRNARGRPIEHYQVLKNIHERIDDMTYGDDGGMDFKFWHVPRERNQEADALANQALSGFVP